MKRRDFLRSLERVAAGTLCAGMSTSFLACSGLQYVPARREGNRLIVQRADLGTTSYVLVDHPEIPRAVFLHRVSKDDFSAVLTRCTHRGCQVEPAGDRLACPCHGSEYRLTGEVLRGPAEQPLARYAVSADADRIYIHLTDVS